jgi:UDP-N-acetyl-D-glucosamine dehydrogenase
LYKTLERKIKNRTAVVGVIGMGYVGLPLAVELGREGFQVIGIDIAVAKIRLVNSGRSDIDDVEDKDLKPLVRAGKIKATNDFAQLKKSDVVLICVPTPLSKTKDPDV